MLVSPPILDRDDLLTLNQAARRLPGRPHRSTLWRWARDGVVTPAGRVYLDIVRLGRRAMVAPEAIDAFARSLTEAHRQERDRLEDAPIRRLRGGIADVEAEATAAGL